MVHWFELWGLFELWALNFELPQTFLRLFCVSCAFCLVMSCSRPAHLVWQQRYNSGLGDFASSVATDGRDIIVGATCRDSSAAPNRTDWEILRYDRNGKLLWRRTYARCKCDSLVALAVRSDHDIVAVGSTITSPATGVKS
jgi:hypothetical protein